uniref:Uncharacterized protein n=1 Tax=Arundo donax TaxID=35708 RepID=A0A0A9FH77_ARUDO
MSVQKSELPTSWSEHLTLSG